ncbi:hypothetical protein Aperf_G00000035536 [Anoplocephala perfoliata]
MSILPSERLYRLYREKRNDIEIFSVKLTDSALKTLENISRSQPAPIKLSVDGSRGTLSFPCKQSSVSYDISISPLHQSSDGTADVIQLLGSRAINLGKAVAKLTVQAKADSFSTAKMKMAEAEDQRKGYAKQNIMPNNKRPNIREGGLTSRSLVTPPSRNGDTQISPQSLARNSSPLANAYKSPVTTNSDVATRSLRDRIIHLLAVQPYQRAELIVRLRRDGLTEEQKDKVNGLLSKVGRTGRLGEFHLSPTFFNLVEPNWPGYSPSERSTVASLKARMSTSSPCNRLPMEGGARVTPSSRQNSPLSVALTQPQSSSSSAAATGAASLEDFGRKPTRASAPSAPHPLQKKIAALDLLASGLSLAAVAAHHGITTTLLEKWKDSEETLRQKYSQRLGSTVPQTTAPPLSSIQEMSKTTTSTAPALADSTSNDAYNNSSTSSGKSSTGSGTSKPSAPKRARLSSSGSGVNSCGSGSSNSGNCPPLQFASSSSTARRSGGGAVAPAPAANSTFKDPSPPSTSKRSPLVSRKRPYDVVGDGGNGAEFSRRNATAISSRQSNGAQSRRANDRGSESSFCLDSSSPAVDTTTPLSQLYARGPVINSKTMDKGQRLDACNEVKAPSASEDDFPYDEITAETTKIASQYPPITNARQAASYRDAFDSLYPPYLELHEHYRVAWDKVISLRDQIMAHAGSQDSQRMTRLATELDEFLNRMRKPEKRKEEVRLLLMTYKLRLLKRHLANFAAQANGSAAESSESSSRNSLRAGASD